MMKPIRVFIMTGGEGTRWTDGLYRNKLFDTLPHYKQAMIVGRMPEMSERQRSIAESILAGQEEETIFHRTIRMVIEAGFDIREIMVVGQRGMWKQPGDGRQFKGVDISIEGEDPVSLLGGIMTIMPLWETDRTIVLLGDVVFSYKALDLILNTQQPVSFLGRPGSNPVIGKEAAELFGFSVSKEMYGIIKDHCSRMTVRGAVVNYPPKLWALYRLVCGFGHDDCRYEDKILLNPQDYTDDLDSVEEYQQFWLGMCAEALSDNAPNS